MQENVKAHRTHNNLSVPLYVSMIPIITSRSVLQENTSSGSGQGQFMLLQDVKFSIKAFRKTLLSSRDQLLIFQPASIDVSRINKKGRPKIYPGYCLHLWNPPQQPLHAKLPVLLRQGKPGMPQYFHSHTILIRRIWLFYHITFIPETSNTCKQDNQW